MPPEGIASGTESKCAPIILYHVLSYFVQSLTVPYIHELLLSEVTNYHPAVQISTAEEHSSIPRHAHALPERLTGMISRSSRSRGIAGKLAGPGMGGKAENPIGARLTKQGLYPVSVQRFSQFSGMLYDLEDNQGKRRACVSFLRQEVVDVRNHHIKLGAGLVLTDFLMSEAVHAE